MNELPERPRRIRKFNPGTFQSDEEVISQFVVRNPELGVVLDVLRANAGSPSCQHVLLVAPRGQGKSMMLARVAAELRTDDELSARLLPVRFMEESQEIFNLADFWLESLFYLARVHATRDPDLSQELRDVHAALAAEWRGRELEERARAAVLETADRLDRQLVLMVENLQALCREVDEDFGWKLRKVLQSEPQVILLATATSRFKELDDAQHAFFELFRIVRLEPLDTGECRRLWQIVSGDDAVSKRKIRPLQILTGGDPRLLVIIGEFAGHRSLRQLMEQLVKLIDDHTEYFRGHLEVFPKAERRVYLAMIDLWQPSTTREIAARARMDVRAVSALLGRLVERGAVIVEGSGRKRMYAASQRLYSIYYKLRRERDEAAVVRSLIQLMAGLYSEAELKDWSHTLALEASQWPSIHEGLMRAVAESPQMDSAFSTDVWQKIRRVSASVAAIHHKQAERILAAITVAVGKGEFEKVNDIADQFLASQETGSPQVPESFIALALLAKACAYEGLDEDEAELAVYDEVLDRFGDSDAPQLQVLIAMTLLRKAITHEQRDEHRVAIATFDEVIERFGNSDAPEIDVQVASALVNKGVRQGRLGDPWAAISTFEEVVDRFGNSEAPEVRLRVAMALVNKGTRLEQCGQTKAAIAALEEVIERFGESETHELDVQVARAWIDKGVMLGQLGEIEAAIDSFDKVIEHARDIDIQEVQDKLAKALQYKGSALEQLGESEAEIAIYDEIIERFGDSDAPEIQAPVAVALVKMGIRHGHHGEAREAIDTFDTVVKRFGNTDMPEVQFQIAVALVNKGVRLGQLGETRAAIVAFDEVVERFGSSDARQFHEGVARALVTKGFALKQLGENEGAIAVYDQVSKRFGDSDALEVQVQVAIALINMGGTQLQLGEMTGALATFDEMVERFGDSDDLDLRERVASALNSRGSTKLQIGEIEAAIDDWEEVVKRFGGGDIPELQLRVVEALVNKTEIQIQLGRTEGALHTCDDLDRRLSILTHKEKAIFMWRTNWLRTKSLLVQQQYPEAMEVFDSVYAAFDPDAETMMLEMLARVSDLIANGASESDLAEILSRDRKKADALLPLLVALRQIAGQTVRAPAEVLEVAADIRKLIEAKAGTDGFASPDTSPA